MAPNGVNGIVAPEKTSKKSRGQLKAAKRQAKRRGESVAPSASESELDSATAASASEAEPEAVKIDLDSIEEQRFRNDDVTDRVFGAIFSRFTTQTEPASSTLPAKGEVIYSDDEADDEEEAEAIQYSKRRLRVMNRLSVAELKRLVKKPEMVEWVDVTALDPRLLVDLKSYRGAVPVPAHWAQKRDYLGSKKGMEKTPFQLPSYIADTGIGVQREAIHEKESGQSLKAKTRERVQPKMGKINIDYQKLHDAFFKYQVPPKMSRFGEMYFEGKELETDLREKRPGELSLELKEALSIPPLAPPPWLISMQRYGAPPSYPTLRIPGLNAPIPDGAQWGFHPGGWGKPPVDEFNRPIYGAEVYAPPPPVPENAVEPGEPIERTLWGVLEPDEFEEDEDEPEEEDDEERGVDMTGLATPSGLQTPAGGFETPSGFASTVSTVPGGLETPEFLDLRKRRDEREGTETDDGRPKQLYQVVPERKAEVGSRGLLGSDRAYDVSGLTGPVLGAEEPRGTKRKQAASAGVAVSLDASELEGISEAELRARYDAQRRNTGSAGQGGTEDFSDFVREEAAKRAKISERKESKRDRGEKSSFKF